MLRSSVLVLALPWLASGALTQQPPAAGDFTPPAASLVWPAGHVATELGADGAIWAATARWKAGFDARGAALHACVGVGAPDAAATFALRAARAGSSVLPLVDGAPVLSGQRVTFDRGAVRELYELREQGIEQMFVLESLPNRESLVLDVGVASTLQHRHDERGHAFVDARGNGVAYGAAVAIDARGRSVPLATEWTGDALRLVVPGSFLADAALPLLVDPLIGPIGDASGASTLALSATDVAYDASLARWFVCYERAFSATDHDVYVAWLDGAMQPQGVVTIDFTSAYWTRPRVAVLEAHDVAGVVAQVGGAGGTKAEVRMRIVAGAATPTAGAVLTLAAGPFDDHLEPDIGGDADPVAASSFLVAWEHRTSSVNDSTPKFRTVAHNGMTTPTQFLGSGIYFERRMAISKTCGRIGGGTEGWAVVHRIEPYQQTTGQLIAWFVTRAGQLVDVVGPYQFVTITGVTDNAGSEWDVSSPTDHANGRTFLCVERRVDPQNGRGALVGHVLDHVGNVLATDVPLLGSGTDRRAPGVDSDGARFAVASENRYSATDSDVAVRTIAWSGGQLLTQDAAVVTTALTRDEQPAMCARSGVPNAYGVAWAHSDATNWRIECQQYRGVGQPTVTTRMTACGGLGISYSGALALGETFTLTIDNQTGFGGFLVGAAVSAPIPGCSGCVLGADGLTLLGSQLQVLVPTNVALVGSMLSFQGARYDPALGPCLGALAFSNTFDVRVQ
jgi:hypothetical protein